MRVEDPAGRVIQEVDPAPRRQVDIDPADAKADPRRPARRGDGARRHLLPDLRRLPGRRSPARPGTAERGEAVEDQSWYAALAPYPNPEVVVVATIERGGFGADAAAPAVQQILTRLLRRQARERSTRCPIRRRRCTNDRRVLDPREPAARPRPARRSLAGGQAQPAAVRRARDRARSSARSSASTSPCAGAAIAIIAFSAYTLGVTTKEDIPGDPYYYVIRQAIYAVIGIALMFTLARIDYSRFRELRVGLYTAMIAQHRAGARAGRGDARLAPLDRAAVLHLPAVGARQAAA